MVTILQPNILVDELRHARLGDFGLANFADSSTASVSAQGTGAIGWTAPELLDPDQFGLRNSRPTSVSDVYSFGSVCWEVSDFLSCGCYISLH